MLCRVALLSSMDRTAKPISSVKSQMHLSQPGNEMKYGQLNTEYIPAGILKSTDFSWKKEVSISFPSCEDKIEIRKDSSKRMREKLQIRITNSLCCQDLLTCNPI